ncbi:adenylate kinase family protein [Candidatus Woesearchaeota archaeon]|nr:adenylate kinase family protein [Candidatus Woesearchaeota archaeon]
MIICVSGTPGTGKTALAKALAKKLNAKYIDVNKIIKANKLEEGFDEKRNCAIVDEEKLSNILIELIQKEKELIIDSHLSHFIPKKYVDLCIITKCDLKVLKKRLQKRGYNEEKIRENLDAEIFDVCLNEALELKHRIIVLDTTTKKLRDLVEEVIQKTPKK